MALKSSNKVDTNVYEIEVTVTPEVFTDACKSHRLHTALWLSFLHI